MANYKNSAQSGEANGTDVSTLNSADPNAFTSVNPGVGGTIKYSTAQKFYGTSSIEFVPASGVACYADWVTIPGATNDFTFRGLVYFTGLPSTNAPVLNIRSSGGGTSIANLLLGSDGKLRVGSDVSGSSDISTGTITVNQWYDISILLSNNHGGTADTFTLNVRDPLTGASDAALSMALTGKNFGTSILGTIRLGRILASGTMAASYWQWISATTANAVEEAEAGPTWIPLSSVVGSTGYTATGGSPIAVISDGSDSTYLTTSNNPTNLELDTALPGITTPVGDLILRAKAYKLGATSGSLVAKLYQSDGTTLVATAASVSPADTTAKWLNIVFPSSGISGVTSTQWASGMRLKVLSTAA
jgi:hypothetical protein